MSNITLMVLLALTGVLIQNNPVWQWILRKVKLETKPFNCTLCWTFWLALGYTLAEPNINILESIMMAAGAAITAELVDRKLNDF